MPGGDRQCPFNGSDPLNFRMGTVPVNTSKCNCEPFELDIIVLKRAQLEVRKALDLDTDDGVFNLYIDEGEADEIEATDQGHDGTTGKQEVGAGTNLDPGATHTFSETAGTATDLLDYVTTWECRDRDGAEGSRGTGTGVTLVEFSDFQCPYCARVAPTLKQLHREFEGQVRIVYRHLPLTSIHPLAFKAAEASMCAQDQDEFWAMHDLIFQEQDRVSVSDLKDKARRLGLNQRDFDSCLDSGRHAELVQQDFEEGQKAGVTGTPALFVNGVRLEGGAVSFDVAAEAIRRELASQSQRRHGEAGRQAVHASG